MIINIDRKNRNINLSVKAKDSVETAATMERMQSEAQTGTTNLGALLKAKLTTNKSPARQHWLPSVIHDPR